MNVAGTFPKSITISFQDEEWVKTLYYEDIPLYFCEFHDRGNIFWDLPLNIVPNTTKVKEETDGEVFVKVLVKQKSSKTITTYVGLKNLNSNNSFHALENVVEESSQ
jgi:hypothetical protein